MLFAEKIPQHISSHATIKQKNNGGDLPMPDYPALVKITVTGSKTFESVQFGRLTDEEIKK